LKTKVFAFLRAASKYILAGWIVGVLGFTIARIVVVWGFLQKYGVNVYGFAVIDLVTAIPYALSIPLLVKAVCNRNIRRVQLWATVWVATFVAPYVYVFIFAGNLPAIVIIVVASYCTLMFALAARRLQKKVTVVHSQSQEGT